MQIQRKKTKHRYSFEYRCFLFFYGLTLLKNKFQKFSEKTAMKTSFLRLYK